MFLQIPVFLGLYHVLRHLSNSAALCKANSNSHLLSLYTFTKSDTCTGARAKLFGAPLAASFRDNATQVHLLGGADVTTTRWVILPLLVVSAVSTMATQLLVRANQPTPPEGTAATVQRLMTWVIPVGVMASGLLFNFPLGVLLYWFTSNLWTLAQQGYIIRFHPHAEEATKPVGELGKSLAPKPGQRPVRMSKAQSVPDDRADGADEPIADAVPTTRTTTPRPGQRPNRPAGKRPPAKRPTQAKKRR
jgi:YidC/Oxa1 family membrane protein insertase